eukprot:454096-Prymnesium_polylepis.2
MPSRSQLVWTLLVAHIGVVVRRAALRSPHARIPAHRPPICLCGSTGGRPHAREVRTVHRGSELAPPTPPAAGVLGLQGVRAIKAHRPDRAPQRPIATGWGVTDANADAASVTNVARSSSLGGSRH